MKISTVILVQACNRQIMQIVQTEPIIGWVLLSSILIFVMSIICASASATEKNWCEIEQFIKSYYRFVQKNVKRVFKLVDDLIIIVKQN